MKPTIKRHNHAEGTSWELHVDQNNKLILVMRHDEPPSLAIGFKCQGVWYYQSLMWSCRAGKQEWFRPMIALYRFIRKEKLTDYSLRYLAWGEKRLKNAGYAIRTPSLANYIAISERIADSKKREEEVAAALKSGLSNLSLGQRWLLESLHGNFYVINEQPRAACAETECITIKAAGDIVLLTRLVGRSAHRQPSDPFRTMTHRRKSEELFFHDQHLAPDELVADALSEAKRLMSTRSDAEWRAAGKQAA